MKPQLKNEKKNESGAIMLEIIAVLALMGVMGAMLFRQINQRNQELHNIQMASEIRLVKEAFSAWIQTNQARLTGLCLNDVARCSATVTHCPQTRNAANRAQLASDVADYLPDGYLVGANSLANNYDLYLYGYWVGQTGMCSPAFYGAVVPKDNVLPDGGVSTSSWNFKRAARIAMLIGADGGAFDPDITGAGNIVGSVGTWRLPTGNSGIPLPDVTKARYVALTGLDVFQPEVEVPAGEINVPADMSWAGRDMGAWNSFVVGGNRGASGCFEINHDTASGKQVVPDVIRVPTLAGAADCDPVFWVDAGDTADKGRVYVRNSVDVGYDKDKKTSSISLMGGRNKDGEVVVNDNKGRTSVIIAAKEREGSLPNRTLVLEDGRILTNSATGPIKDGGSGTGYQYQLDPANTSVMYDIRLGARGGIKLTDLLPKNILQDVGQIDCKTTDQKIKAPTCKSGYQPALMLLPSVNPKKLDADTKNSMTETEWQNMINAGGVRTVGLIESGSDMNVKKVTDKTGTDIDVAAVTNNTRQILTVHPVKIMINTTSGAHRVATRGLGEGASPSSLTAIAPNSTTKTWNVVCDGGEGVIGYQTYCMYTSSVKNDNDETNGTVRDARQMTKEECLANGMGWHGTDNYCYTLNKTDNCGMITTGYTYTIKDKNNNNKTITITLGERCRRSGCLFISSTNPPSDTSGNCVINPN